MVALDRDLEVELVRVVDSGYTFNVEPTDCLVFA